MDIRLEDSDLYRTWPCCACGAWFALDAVVARAYIDSHILGYVCPTCLEAGAAGMTWRIRQRVARLRQEADNLDALASRDIHAPSIEAFHTRLAERLKAIEDTLPL